MNSATLDWLDLTVILSTFAACAAVGWFAARLMNRFEVVEPMEPVAPIRDVQQIEVTVVDRGWRVRRRPAGPTRAKFKVHPERSSHSLKDHEQGD
jgi:hypothetical protein